KKELISYAVSLGKNRAVISAETDVIVPDTKPDAEKILKMDTDARLNGFEVQNGRVLVFGTVKFNVLYYSPEGELKNVKTECAFTDVLEIMGAEPGLEADVLCRVDKSDCRILNGRKLSVKAGVEVTAEVFKEESLEAVCHIDKEAVEQQTRKIQYIKKNPLDVQLFQINEQAEIAGDLPAAFEILRAEGKINNKNLKVISNKVIVKADLDISVLYTDDVSHNPCSVSVSLPFTEILEIDGISEEWMLIHDMDELFVECSLSEDTNGEMRILELETAVESRAATAVPCVAEVVSDCYGIMQKTETVKQTVKLKKQTGEIRLQTGLKTQIDLSDKQKIAQVYNVCAKAVTEGVEKGEKELYAKGKAKISVIYADDDSKLGCLVKEVPFKEILRNVAKDCEEAEISAEVKGLSYTLNGENSVEVRGNLELFGMLSKNENENLITDVSFVEKENKKKGASLTVCFVQSDESLWDIAKKYETSVNLICEANGIKENEPLCGKKLIVPKYKK
ncbi:MAG: DUF3794 domain-containing protein, partial [Clostridia bacterium]|nr:DUF3794 domain-containing protein [Clostridia bacterium]